MSNVVLLRAFYEKGKGRCNLSNMKGETISVPEEGTIQTTIVKAIEKGLLREKKLISHDDVLIISVRNEVVYRWLLMLDDKKPILQLLNILDLMDCKYKIDLDTSKHDEIYIPRRVGLSGIEMFKDM